MKATISQLNLPIKALSELICSRTLSCEELIEATLERIDKLNPTLNGYITVLGDSARAEAKKADSLIRQGEYRGPLHGIPLSLKDLIYVKDVRSTSGSKILADFVPDFDSTVVAKLKQAGAIIIGTNNTHEFACGITSINPHFGPSRNPWDSTRISGGSSGGSAVAVSTGMSAGALGTDTSGSIRVPSSLCGLFGLKPTYGRVSKFGVMPLAPSIDHVGPIARSPWDAACILQYIAGYDDNDPSTANIPVPNYLQEISKESGNFKVGIPKQFFFDLIEPDVREVFDKFVDKASACDISSVPVNVKHTDKILDTWKAFRLGESAATHQEWLTTRSQDYGEDVVTMLRKGLEITAVHYINAHKWRDDLKRSLVKAMDGLDALLVPTTVIPAPLVDQNRVDINGKSYDVYKTLSRLTTVFDVTGLPVLNIPSGFVDGRLPVGVQLVGRPFGEEQLLKIGEAYEQKYKVSHEMIPEIVV